MKTVRHILTLIGVVLFAGAGATATVALMQNQSPPELLPRPSPPLSNSAQGTIKRTPIWISPYALRQLPERGPAWKSLLETAKGDFERADIADQNSNHDVQTLAAALVYGKTDKTKFRRKAAKAIRKAIGTEQGGRTLALGRNLVSYVIAADVINLAQFDPELDSRFRAWLNAVRSERFADDRTLIETHEQRPNNWGTIAGASRMAVALYLGDLQDFARAAKVFQGYVGDTGAYSGFKYGDDRSWQSLPARPVGVNPTGARKSGYSVGGALPDDMRRGCSFKLPPCLTEYAWGALQGAAVQAQILSRHGYPAWKWGDNAMLRAASFLYGLNRKFGGWSAEGDDSWVVWLINRAYRTNFPTHTPVAPGKNMGWTDWTAPPRR